MRAGSSTSGGKGGFEGVPQPGHQQGLSGYAGSSVKPDMTGTMSGPVSFGNAGFPQLGSSRRQAPCRRLGLSPEFTGDVAALHWSIPAWAGFACLVYHCLQEAWHWSGVIPAPAGFARMRLVPVCRSTGGCLSERPCWPEHRGGPRACGLQASGGCILREGQGVSPREGREIAFLLLLSWPLTCGVGGYVGLLVPVCLPPRRGFSRAGSAPVLHRLGSKAAVQSLPRRRPGRGSAISSPDWSAGKTR